ncbi:hypothetical protein [Psychrobacillus sp. FSL K6-1464]
MENQKNENDVFYHVGDKRFTNEDEATRYERDIMKDKKRGIGLIYLLT